VRRRLAAAEAGLAEAAADAGRARAERRGDAAAARRARQGLDAAQAREAELLSRAELAETSLADMREAAEQARELAGEGLRAALAEAEEARESEARARALLAAAERGRGGTTASGGFDELRSLQARAAAAERDADVARQAAAEAEEALSRARRMAEAERRRGHRLKQRLEAAQREWQGRLGRLEAELKAAREEARSGPERGSGSPGGRGEADGTEVGGAGEAMARLRRQRVEALMSLAGERERRAAAEEALRSARQASAELRESSVERRVVGRLLVEWCARPEKRADVARLMSGMLSLSEREQALIAAAAGGDTDSVPTAEATADASHDDAVGSLAKALGSFVSGGGP